MYKNICSLLKGRLSTFVFLQTGLTITLAVVAALQSIVIVYGLQKHYEFWSRSWVVTKNIFNLLKSKFKKEKFEEKQKGKEIQLKIRKSSLKRFGNTINCVC